MFSGAEDLDDILWPDVTRFSIAELTEAALKVPEVSAVCLSSATSPFTFSSSFSTLPPDCFVPFRRFRMGGEG